MTQQLHSWHLSQGIKTYADSETHTWMFPAASCVIAKNLKQQSFNGQIVKQTVVHPHHGILLSNKNEWTTDTCNNLHESPEDYAEWKKPTPKAYILCDCIYIVFLKWQNCGNGEESSGCQYLRRELVEREVGLAI